MQIVFRTRKILRTQALAFSSQSQRAVRITCSRHLEQMSIQVSIVAGSRFPFNEAKPRRIWLAIPVEWRSRPTGYFVGPQSSIDPGAYPAHTGRRTVSVIIGHYSSKEDQFESALLAWTLG